MSLPERSRPKVFVGTLYCGEAEFEDCLRAIEAQVGVQIHHEVIRDLPELEAHNRLWQAWEKHRSEYDLFVKVDADTVLGGRDALLSVWRLFEKDPDVTGAQILLKDYFTDSLISGLNFFSPKVGFRASRDPLFADHSDYGHVKVLKGDATRALAPIGYHCKYPSTLQAFHYGFHRVLKGQARTISLLAQAWLRYRDEPRKWALAGALAGEEHVRQRKSLRNRIGRLFLRNSERAADYSSAILQRSFKRLSNDRNLSDRIAGFAQIRAQNSGS